uniref:NADH-ubiquinone oxidoreductase chain 5 n=1 Tax=Trypanobia cryptica TaxID=2814713 RepID=A0A0K0YD95_9ANNE|nr:NADH dehydrogenase subunit 5 [Trypanobia cryptica]
MMSITWFLSSLLLFISEKTILIEWTLSTPLSSAITVPVILDPMGLLFSSTVLFISSNVLMFSKLYMKNDPLINKFTWVVLLFILSMNILIMFPNMISLLLGWDGLGMTSFILVIYYKNKKSLSAGLLTALTNRLGDIGIIIAITWMLSEGHWNIMNIAKDLVYNKPYMIMILMLAATTKSAQIPFSSWLPAAMAAPTPVSALVHSSTLVTAGVFLLYRLYPFLSLLPMFNSYMKFIGSLTMVMAGIIAMLESDMKKIIALSTLSQLGLMMMTLGLNLPTLTFFHLITHALFKSLLFMCAGILINMHSHNQDLRIMSNTNYKAPHIMSTMLISNTALCAFPFMAGFYSKDLIIENLLFSNIDLLSFMMMMSGTMLTTMYSTRFMMNLTMSSPQSSPLTPKAMTNEMNFPIINLSMGSIMGGAILNWMLSPMPPMILPPTMKSLPLLWITSSIMMMIILSYLKEMNLSESKKNNMLMITSMFFMVPTSTQFMMKSWKYLPLKSTSIIDQGWIMFMIPNSTLNISLKIIKPQFKFQPLDPLSSMFQMTMFMMIPLLMVSLS